MYDTLLTDGERRVYIQPKLGGSWLLFHLLFLIALQLVRTRRKSMHQDCLTGVGHLIRKGT